MFRVAFQIHGCNEDPSDGAVPYICIYLEPAQQRSKSVSKSKYGKAAPPRGSGAVLEQVKGVLEAGCHGSAVSPGHILALLGTCTLPFLQYFWHIP